MPLNRLSSINKISKAIPYLEQEFEREPTNTEIAEYLDLTEFEIKTANDIKKRQISFDKPLANDSESDFSLYDVVQTGNIPDTDNNLLRESIVINLKRALSKLSLRESEIIVMIYGLFNTPAYSLHDIAEKYDMSSERVRQIKGTGIIKLKKLLKENYSFVD